MISQISGGRRYSFYVEGESWETVAINSSPHRVTVSSTMVDSGSNLVLCKTGGSNLFMGCSVDR